MKNVTFHCDCGERIAAGPNDVTVVCSGCDQEVEVPGLGDGRPQARRASSATDLSEIKRSGRAPRSSTRASGPRRSVPAPGGSNMMAGVAALIGGMVLAGAAAMFLMSDDGGGKPEEAVSSSATGPEIGAKALAAFARRNGDRGRYHEAFDNSERLEAAEMLRKHAAAFFQPEGVDAAMELEKLIDQLIERWNRELEGEEPPVVSSSSAAVSSSAESSSSAEASSAAGGTPSFEALRLYLESRPARTQLIAAYEKIARGEDDDDRWETRARQAQKTLLSDARQRFPGADPVKLIERTHDVLHRWREEVRRRLVGVASSSSAAASSKAPTFGPWTSPPGGQPNAAWAAQNGVFTGKGADKFAPITFGPDNWRDMQIVCEVQIKKGSMGFFVRGMDRAGQFSGFLQRAGIQPQAGKWYRLLCQTRGRDLVVELHDPATGKRLGQQLRSQQQAPFKSSVFGFMVHAGSEVVVRKLRVRQIK